MDERPLNSQEDSTHFGNVPLCDVPDKACALTAFTLREGTDV